MLSHYSSTFLERIEHRGNMLSFTDVSTGGLVFLKSRATCVRR
jgi:hypothetical protein